MEDTKLIEAADEALPQHPMVTGDSGVDVSEPDKYVPAGSIDGLPRVSDLPPDWRLVSMHAISAELDINTTLPRIWELSTKQDRERLIVRLSSDLVHNMIPPWQAMVCDAMPEDAAEDFVKWAGAQVFLRRATRQYIECEVHRWVFRLPEGQRDGFILAADTNRGSIRPAPGSMPVAFWYIPAEPNLLQRAKAAMEDMTGLLTPLPPAVHGARRIEVIANASETASAMGKKDGKPQ